MSKLTKACDHTITRGREGETGSWCVSCGVKVWEVHDRPCGECSHFEKTEWGSMCRKHFMRVTPSLKVTFNLIDPKRALCFESSGRAALAGRE